MIVPSFTPPARPNILSIAPYIGGEARAEGTGRLIRLASNESPYGTPPAAQEAMARALADSFRYPDGGCEALRERLGASVGVPASQIVCGAGSEELIRLLATAYAGPGDEVLSSQYGFLMYPIAARLVGADSVVAPEGPDLTAHVDALLAHVSPRTKLLFLANPNNPTGSLLPYGEVERLRACLPPHVLLVLDAAYAEYVAPEDHPDYQAGHALVAQGNVVVLRTFSKMYGLAGLRLGWAHGPPAVADALNRARGPFNVSSLAQVAGLAALGERDFVEKVRLQNHRVKARFSEQLASRWRVFPSAANFVLVDIGPTAETLRLALKAQGILVRQMGAYGLPHALRISIGRAEEMEDVTRALAAL